MFSKQVRSPEDEKGEEFLGLVESVSPQGVIEPVAVVHGELTVEAVLNHFITYGRAPENLEKGLSGTVSDIVKNSGKSSRSLQRIISLQILPAEAREAVRTGKLTVSQGYIFADNVAHSAKPGA